MAERSLLLVDDEENILSALTRLFRREGYEIFRATGGKAGLEILQQHEVDIIISDQRMPEMMGVEFLSKVKELYPDTVRIVLSGYTDLNSITDAINQGAVYKFLTKPWDDELLLKNVRDAFQHVELKKDNERLTRELRSANERLNEINKDLALQISAETGEALRNLKILQMSQEILDCLPLGVMGVDDHGVLVMVNRAAQVLLAHRGPIKIGALAQEELPAPLVDLLARETSTIGEAGIMHMDGASIQVWCSRLGRSSEGRGTVLALAPKSNG